MLRDLFGIVGPAGGANLAICPALTQEPLSCYRSVDRQPAATPGLHSPMQDNLEVLSSPGGLACSISFCNLYWLP